MFATVAKLGPNYKFLKSENRRGKQKVLLLRIKLTAGSGVGGWGVEMVTSFSLH